MAESFGLLEAGFNARLDDWRIFSYVFRVAGLSLVPRLDYLDRVQYITHLLINLQLAAGSLRVLFRAVFERIIMSFLVI